MVNLTIDRYIEKLGDFEPVKRITVQNGSAVFVGDTHGAMDVTAYSLMVSADADCICFLGDVVDRGTDQLLNLLLVLEAAIVSRRVLLLRGNHESGPVNEHYGFVQELRGFGILGRVYPHILKLYGRLPYALVLNDRVLAFHGGIPNNNSRISDWDKLPADDDEPSNPTAMQILWNDPREGIAGFHPSPRGAGIYLFGEDVFEDFLEKNGIELVIRGHEIKMEGIEFLFGHRLASVYSSRYHGGEASLLRLRIIENIKQEVVLVPDDTLDHPIQRK